MNKDYCELSIDYFNGTLSEEEKQAFEQHLLTCEVCRAEMEDLKMLSGHLPFLSEEVQPPKGMKDRIFKEIFQNEEKQTAAKEDKVDEPAGLTSKQKRKWQMPALAAALLLSVIGNGYAVIKLSEKEPVQRAEEKISSIALQPGENFDGNAEAYLIQESNGLKVIVNAEGLEQTEGEQVYQVWLIHGGNPVPAGSFVPDSTSKGTAFYQAADSSSENWDTIAVTLEPRAGNSLPEGQIVLSSEL
ncbi:hypothetical protein B9K06_20880 [Bacillus sp. OG2]|nr:hypothetical protein B9K06_20880 [Bacillus sp. OG2]